MSDLTHGRGRGIRPRAVLSTLVALAAVAMLTLAPRSIVAPARHAFQRAADEVFAPVTWLPNADAERVLNTIMFIPLGVAVALLLSRRAWPVAIAAGFLLSTAVEYAQGSIPGRVPDSADIVWNTAGTAIGVVVVMLGRWVAAVVRRLRRASSHEQQDISPA